MVLFKTLFFLAICVHGALAAANQTFTHPSYPGYKITIIDLNSKIPAATTDALRARFWAVYPKMVNDYNPNAAKAVKFIYDANHKKNPAEAGGDTVRFNAEYMINNPKDYDIVTHETFHLVQAGYMGCTWYIREGLADWMRYKYGLTNSNTNWALPAYADDQYYDKGYRITAAFINYLEEYRFWDVPQTIFQACKDGAGYSDDENEAWNNMFGESLDDLWNDYANN